MDQFINSLPRTVIAIGAIIIGFFLMRLNDPPVTVCDLQMNLFRESQKKFLYSASDLGKPSMAKEAYEICKGDNSPGGCFEYFENLKKLTVDLTNIPEQCAAKAAEEPQIQTWVQRSLKLMVQMAWGERAPASYVQKNGWFDASDISLFCDLKRSAIRIFGNDVYSQWREEILMSVPDYEKIGREQAWQKSLVSTPCDHYR